MAYENLNIVFLSYILRENCTSREADHVYEYERGCSDAGRWVDSEELAVGDDLLLFGGDAGRITAINSYPAEIKVYNFTVGEYHNYAVADAGVLVHNRALYNPVEGPNGAKDVIFETLNSRGNITSQHTLSADDALSAGIEFIGPGYREIGKPGSGVFRSNEMFDGYYRQFRIDGGSLSGNHRPHIDHFHLQLIDDNDIDVINNHIPYKD